MAIRTVGFPRPHQEPGEVRDFPPSVLEFLQQFDLDAVVLEDGYGTQQGLTAADYSHPKLKYGAVADAYAQDLVVTLRCPRGELLAQLKPGATLLSMLHFPTRPDRVQWCEARGVPGVEVTCLDVELASDAAYLQQRLARTDLLIDATQRRDTTQVIVKNAWLALMPAHAVVLDLSVDPYDFSRTPPGVKAVEGIPQGSLDQFVFAPDDPAWESLDARVPHSARRSVCSCYSWPGIDPAACMRVYGKQIEPVLRALIEKGPERLAPIGGPWMERATARAMHHHFLPSEKHP